MNRKVKKGSALVTVMLFSLLFLTMSSVSVLAVINTLKGNSGESLYQTLYYEAEAGLEKAIAFANRGDYDHWIVGDRKDSITDPSNYGFPMNIGYVRFSVEKKVRLGSSDEYLLAISTSTYNGTSRTVKADLSKYIYAPDIFKYSICGEKVEVESGGTINMNPSRVNSSLSDAQVTGVVNPGDKTKENFELPNFDSSRIAKNNGDLVINEIEATPTTPKVTFVDILDSLSGVTGGCVKKISLTSPSFDVYLVNTDSMTIVTSGFTEENIMIICSGNIKFDMSGEGLLSKSSIVGKEIKISDKNLQISFRPYDETNPDGALALHSPLYRTHLEKLMNGYNDAAGNSIRGISYYAPNYGYGGSPSGSSLDYNVSNYE